MKISDFLILSNWIEKYNPASNKSAKSEKYKPPKPDSSWDNSYCRRLVLVSYAVNIVSGHNDIENIKSNLNKNAYSPFLVDKVIKKYLDYKFPSNQNQLRDKSDVHYFKLPYIGNLSHHIKFKLSKVCKEFCK